MLNVLSDITLIGRGRVTSIIDMPGREYEADRFAARKTNIKTIKEAIEKRQEAILSIALDTFEGVEEDDDKFDVKEILKKYYDLFTGTGIRGYIHPTYGERIEFLDSLSE